MSRKDELLEKIKAVKALAERGVDGEKESAQATLARLMEKYGVTDEELETERVQTAWFRYRDEFESRILRQVIYMVTGKVSFGCVGTYTNRTRKKRGVDCTAAERLEIEANYSFFLAAAKKELEIFLTAFASKNRLYPSPEKDTLRSSDDRELTPEERARYLKAGLMAEGMERHTLEKMLEGDVGNG